MTTPPVPTGLLPGDLSTVNSSYFAVGCTLGVHPVKQKAQWQVATDIGFTASLHTIDSAYSNPGALSGMVASPRIPQGNVYVRVRAIEQTSGDASAWSAYQTAIISHPSSSLLVSPANSQNVVWQGGVVDFEWEFSDQSAPDVQTAYQLKIVADSSDNSYATVVTVYEDYTAMQAANLTYAALVLVDIFGQVYDSGKVTSSINQLSVMLPIQYKDVPIRWTLQTWDNDDATSEPSDSNLFFASDAPEISISYPTTTITTPTPTITWTYFSESSTLQDRYNLKIIDSSTSSYVYDSGWVASVATSQAIPALILKNAKSYVLLLTVISANGMSVVKQKAFTSQWAEPSNPSFSITTTDYQLENKVYLNWTGAPKSTTFVEWRIYRRELSSAPWELAGTTDLFTFIDYFPYPNDTTQYSVTQVAVLFGEYVESSWIPVSVDLSTSKYLLIVRDSPEVFLMFESVVSDSYEIEREEFIMNVLGSGRKSEVGTNMGVKGSLDIHLRDMGTVGLAAASLKSIENIINENAVCVLRTPFEKKYQVHIGNLSVDRIAGVVSGITDVSLDYAEVI